MSVINGNSPELIVKNGLILNLDAGNRKSYVSGSDTWFDLSGNNNSGSLKNGTFFTSSFGGGFVFDGVDDYILTPLKIDANPYTVSAWCYPYNTSGARGIFLTDNQDWDKGVEINNGYWAIHVGNTLVFTGVPASVNTWYNCCIVYATDNIYFYVNGIKVWTFGEPPRSTSGSTIEIGRANYPGGNGTRFFTGVVSTLTAYNRVLSNSEILQNYNANKSRFATSSLSISNVPKVPTNGLILSLDAANPKSYVSGSNTIYDLSGNNITGSVFGNPVYSSEGKGTIVFDGVNDYIENNGYTPNANTISVWLKMNSTSNGPVIYVGNDIFNTAEWNWSIHNAGNNFDIYNVNTWVVEFNPVPTNEWAHWTLVRSDSNSRTTLYKNGVLCNQTYSPSTTNTYNGFRIGKSGSTYGSFSLGLVEMYDRALTYKEVRNLYTSTKDRFNIRPEPYTSYVGTVLHLDAGNSTSYTNGSTDWYDISGLNNHAKLLNGVSYSSTEGSGSLVFDGTNDYVSAVYTGSLNSFYTNTTRNMTAEVWFKLSKYQGDWVRLFGKGDGGNRTFGLWAGPNSQSLYQRYGPNGNLDVNGTNIVLNTWYHMVGVSSGSTHTLYLNGTSVGSGAGPSEYASYKQGCTVGYGNIHSYFTGSISTVKLYNYPLTAAEVSQSYNATKGRYGL